MFEFLYHLINECIRFQTDKIKQETIRSSKRSVNSIIYVILVVNKV
jgi:hypothetical protein